MRALNRGIHKARRSIGFQPAGSGFGRVLWARVERYRRVGRGVVDSVDYSLEQKQVSRREPKTAADHHAVISRACQLLRQHRTSRRIGWDHAKVGLLPPLLYFRDSDRNSSVDLFGVEARRQGGVREIDGFRLLADEQYTRHGVSP